MKIVFILILFYAPSRGGGVAMQEFSSKVRCQQALEKIVNKSNTQNLRLVDGLCVMK